MRPRIALPRTLISERRSVFVQLQPTCCDRSVEVIRQRRFKVLPFASSRVTKTELPCVQHLAGKMFGERGRVNFVAQHRITKMMQMHPNLMRAATVQFAFNQTGLLARTENAIFSLGRATVGRTHAHSLSMHRMSPNFVLDYARLFPQFPGD